MPCLKRGACGRHGREEGATKTIFQPSVQPSMQFMKQKREQRRISYVIFRVAKQMKRDQLDIVGEICITDDEGNLCLSNEQKNSPGVPKTFLSPNLSLVPPSS